jgi:hypothetical protein
MMDGVYAIPANTRDISSEVIDARGRLRIMPAAYYKGTTGAERSFVCVKHGLYGLPTVELCEWLHDRIGERQAIEIGAGNGAMAEFLAIRATDNYMQQNAAIHAYYRLLGQPPITYGENVERLEALDAVKKYQPQVVIGSWITHRYNPAEHWRGGNQYGPDTKEILRLCDEYVLIGNEKTHARDPLWELPHEVFYPPWLFSRVDNYARDFVAVWKGAR